MRLLAPLTVALLLPAPAFAQNQTVVIDSAAAVPGGNGAFVGFGPPVVNDAGRVAFGGFLDGTAGGGGDDFGLFAAGAGLPTTAVVREGQALPGAGGGVVTFDDQFAPIEFGVGLNDAGQVGFNVPVTGPVVGRAAGLGGGPGDAPFATASTGDGVPGGGTFGQALGVRPTGIFVVVDAVSLDGVGAIAFRSTVDGSPADSGVFEAGPGGVVRVVALAGQADPTTPAVGDVFVDFDAPQFAGAGRIGFAARVEEQFVSFDEALYLSENGGLSRLASRGEAVPGGGTLSTFGPYDFNDAGQAGFVGTLTPAGGGGGGSGLGLFRAGPGGGLVEYARAGEPAPDGDGTVADSNGIPDVALNDAGGLAFRLRFEDGDVGLYLSDGGAGGTSRRVARTGDAAPGGGEFSNVQAYALNDAGQVAFFSSLAGAAGSTGLFFHDDALGLLAVARAGDPLLGGTLRTVGFAGVSSDPASIGRGTGLNDAGQVAFSYSLEDGRSGVAIWTVPEPAAAGVAGVIAGGALLRRRRVGPAARGA